MPSDMNTDPTIQALRDRIEAAEAHLAFVTNVHPSAGELKRAEIRLAAAKRRLAKALSAADADS